MLSRRAGLSATAGLSCISPCATGFSDDAPVYCIKGREPIVRITLDE